MIAQTEQQLISFLSSNNLDSLTGYVYCLKTYKPREAFNLRLTADNRMLPITKVVAEKGRTIISIKPFNKTGDKVLSKRISFSVHGIPLVFSDSYETIVSLYKKDLKKLEEQLEKAKQEMEKENEENLIKLRVIRKL